MAKHLQEATVSSLHEAMQSGRLTAVQLVQLYLFVPDSRDAVWQLGKSATASRFFA